MSTIKNKIIRVLLNENLVLFISLEFITILCLLFLALFDLERGSPLINIIYITKHEIPELSIAGLLWVFFAFVELYLAMSNNYSKLVNAYRILTIAIVPSYIVYKLTCLHIEIYSADIALFVLFAVCQITLNIITVINRINIDILKHVK